MQTNSKILFVDDEERILRSLKMLFKAQYDVITTTDGREAVEIVKRENIHVLVSDQRMPGMTGVELLSRVKACSPNTLRLLLTGYADLDAAIEAVNGGEVFRYISKPWDSNDIRATVDQAVRIARSLESFPEASDAPASAEVREVPAVLVVDRDEGTHAVLRDIVARDALVECRLLSAADMDEAFDILREHEVAVLVVGLNIDDDDTTRALKTLKRYRPDILSIVLASYKDTQALVELINQGQIFRFLPKPARRGLVGPGVRSALDRHRRLRLQPALLRRHAVEEAKGEVKGKLSGKVLAYFNRLRGRSAGAGVTA